MKVVAPKKEQLAIVMEEYRIVMEALAVKEAELKEVMDKVHPSGSGSSCILRPTYEDIARLYRPRSNREMAH